MANGKSDGALFNRLQLNKLGIYLGNRLKIKKSPTFNRKDWTLYSLDRCF